MEITITINENDDGYVEEQLTKIQCSLISLNRKVDKMSVDITHLSSVIDELAEAEGAAVAELQDLATQIQGLEVGSITQDQVDALAEKASAAVEALTVGTTAAKEAAPNAPVEEPTPPSAGPTKPVYTVNSEASLEGIDTTQYTESGFETVPSEEASQPLFYFSGDADGSGQTGTANGGNAAYAVYLGATQAA